MLVVSKLVLAFYLLAHVTGWALGTLLTWHLLFNTRLWWMILAYLVWVLVWDRDVAERGGRKTRHLRYLRIWNQCSDYFPTTMECEAGCVLDAKKNYLFACFPHGVLPVGLTVCTMVKKHFGSAFPHHEAHILLLNGLFHFPIYREYVLNNGFVSPSARSLRWLLKRPQGGNIACLCIGGAKEALNCFPGNHRLVLKNRKGFVKIALESGSPLVPVYTFGEVEIYDQAGRDSPTIRWLQNFILKVMGFALVLPMGCGLFQERFGLVPRRKPLTVVVGRPILVEKIANPSQEEIDRLHRQFMDALAALFESHKHKYVEDADRVSLIME